MPFPAVVAPVAPPIALPESTPADPLDLVVPPPVVAPVGANASPRDQLIAGGDPAAPMLGPPVGLMAPPPGAPAALGAPGLPASPLDAPVTPAPPAVVPVLPTGEVADIAKANEAQQATALAEGAVKTTGADAIAAEQSKAAAERQQQADDLRVENEQNQLANDEAHRQTEDALTDARKTAIPKFWEGREGKRLETRLWMILGGIGAGLAGQPNEAVAAVQHDIDSYYRVEKEKIDNLYKYAERRGQFDQESRLQQAQRLAALQVQYGETSQAAAQKIESMKTALGGRADSAAGDALATQLAAKGQEQILAARKTYAEINKLNAEANRANAKAKAAGAGGGAGSGDAVLKLKEAIVNGTDDGKGGKRALNAAEIQRFVNDNKLAIPAEAKAGRPSVASITKDVQFVAGSSAKAAASELKLTEADEARAIRDPKTGAIKGLAASTREVPQLRKLLINYDQGIESLKELIRDDSFFKSAPKGSLWDNAVLAIAATTTAGQTDANVKHEAGTMLNRAGIVDKEAIARKVRDLETRRDQFYRTLSPAKDTGGSGAKPGNLPAGAVMGKNKDGVRGYKVPGQPFVAL